MRILCKGLYNTFINLQDISMEQQQRQLAQESKDNGNPLRRQDIEDWQQSFEDKSKMSGQESIDRILSEEFSESDIIRLKSNLGTSLTEEVLIPALKATITDKGPAKARNIIKIVRLFYRVKSILQKGVLTPADLAKQGIDFTASSDEGNHEKISLFDIKKGRNTNQAEERFPYPGHQSIGPILERRGIGKDNDVYKHISGMLKAAHRAISSENKSSPILETLTKFIADINKNFKDTFAENENIDTLENFDRLTKKILSGERLFGNVNITSAFFSYAVQAGRLNAPFEIRADSSAMFIAAGEENLKKSQLFSERQSKGADVQELRTEKSLEPEAITHLLLPVHMTALVPQLKQIRGDIDIRLVDEIVNVQVGYYNAATRVSTEAKIKVPNYQAEVDKIRAEHNDLLTHITNVDIGV